MEMVGMGQFWLGSMVVVLLGKKHQKGAIACAGFGVPNKYSSQRKACTLHCSFYTKKILPFVFRRILLLLF